MKSLLLLTAALAAVYARDHKLHYKTWQGYKEGDRYFYMAGDDGKPYLVDSKETPDENAISNYTCCPGNNGYWLYTRSNREYEQVLIMGDENGVRKSNFRPAKTTVVLSHGWLGDGYTEMIKLLTKVILDTADCNVIALDWSTLSKRGYVTARSAVPKVGRMLGKFLNWLHEAVDMPFRYVHLMGHSLGGHLVGNAGKELRGRASRITALDPAGPLWYLDKDHRVAKTDAKHVEIIHTNSFGAGYPFPCGHSDHYPNGGQRMIGCHWWDIVCHHQRSWKYMASSIEHDKFFANKCKNLHEVWENWCNGKEGLMGNMKLYKHQYGLYRINTKAKYPYI